MKLSDDLEKFCVALYWLAEKYPTQVDGNTSARILTDQWIHDYFDALADLSIERIEQGTKWHYGHSKFFPEFPADLRESINSMPVKPAKEIEHVVKQLEGPAEVETPPELVAINLAKILQRCMGQPDFVPGPKQTA